MSPSTSPMSPSMRPPPPTKFAHAPPPLITSQICSSRARACHAALLKPYVSELDLGPSARVPTTPSREGVHTSLLEGRIECSAEQHRGSKPKKGTPPWIRPSILSSRIKILPRWIPWIQPSPCVRCSKRVPSNQRMVTPPKRNHVLVLLTLGLPSAINFNIFNS